MDENDQPLVSIVVPVYNRAHLIERSIGSLLAQTYRNIEVLIVDDGSTDDLESAVAIFNDRRAKILRLSENHGASAARNAGVAAAQGEFLAFHDSDDIALPHKIMTQMKVFSALDQSYIGVYTALIAYSETNEQEYRFTEVRLYPAKDTEPLSGDMYFRTLQGNCMNLPTMLLRTSAIFEAGGFDNRLRNNNDWDFTLRLTLQGKLYFISEPLYLAPSPPPNLKSDKISQSFSNSAKSFAFITGKLRRAGVPLTILSRHYVATARYLMRTKRPRQARRYLWTALTGNSLQIKLWFLLALSYFPSVYASHR